MSSLAKRLITSAPIAFVIRKSKRVRLPGFEGIPLYDVVDFFFKQVRTIGITERAAAVSFNFLMAIPPLSIFFFTLLAHLPGSKNFYREFLNLTRQFTPNQSTYLLVKSLVDDFFRPGSALLSTGIILALYFSSNAMMMLQRTFNRSMHYIPVKKKNFVQVRWNAIRLTLIIIVLLLVTILVMLTQGTLLKLIFKWLEVKSEVVKTMVKTLRIVISVLLVYYGTALIYRYGPALHKRWPIRSPGALLSTTLNILAIFLFSYWVNNFAMYNKVYGSIGSVIVLMILVYINSLMLMIGFELNVSISSLKEMAAKRDQTEKELRQSVSAKNT